SPFLGSSLQPIEAQKVLAVPGLHAALQGADAPLQAKVPVAQLADVAPRFGMPTIDFLAPVGVLGIERAFFAAVGHAASTVTFRRMPSSCTSPLSALTLQSSP